MVRKDLPLLVRMLDTALFMYSPKVPNLLPFLISIKIVALQTFDLTTSKSEGIYRFHLRCFSCGIDSEKESDKY